MVSSLQPEAYDDWNPGKVHDVHEASGDWSPGRVHEVHELGVWDPGGIRSTIGAIAAAINRETNDLNSEPCTDFDSHANMPVVGRNSFTI